MANPNSNCVDWIFTKIIDNRTRLKWNLYLEFADDNCVLSEHAKRMQDNIEKHK